MVKQEDVKESVDGKAGVTLVHIPTGCHVHVDSSPSRFTNRAAAMRLLQSRLANWEKIPKGTL